MKPEVLLRPLGSLNGETDDNDNDNSISISNITYLFPDSEFLSAANNDNDNSISISNITYLFPDSEFLSADDSPCNRIDK